VTVIEPIDLLPSVQRAACRGPVTPIRTTTGEIDTAREAPRAYDMFDKRSKATKVIASGRLTAAAQELDSQRSMQESNSSVLTGLVT